MFKYSLAGPLRTVFSASQTFNQTRTLLSQIRLTIKPQSTGARHSSSTRLGMTSKLSFEDAVLNRRSIYKLTTNAPQSDQRIQEIIKNVLIHTPSSFNSQSTRLVVLLGAEHDKFWEIVTDALKAIVPEDKWDHTAQRLSWFSGSYGTVSLP